MRDLLSIAQERQAVNDAIRAFFRSREYLEVETPILVKSPDLSPNLTHFVTTLQVPGAPNRVGALITSPEFSMKKLLGQGMDRIFTITKVFRNEEALGGTHNPEFSMLEWYRSGADYRDGMDETEALVRHVWKTIGKAKPLADTPFRRLRVRDLMIEKCAVDLDTASKADLEAACDRLGVHRDATDTDSDLYYRLFLAKVEGDLGMEPVFIYDYPAFQAALARLTPDGRYGERFELYIEGVELCNAFSELTNAPEQRARFLAEDQERAEQGKPRFPVDEDLLALLPSVRSPAFGNALGIDRLHMLAVGTTRIEDVLLFPANRLFL